MWQPGDATNVPFKNNVPDPLLSGKELPTFKFALEQSEGKVAGGSYGKEATVEDRLSWNAYRGAAPWQQVGSSRRTTKVW